MNENESFHKAILTNPKERTVHLVFADWLEEQGEIFEAHLRRTDVKLYLNKKTNTIWIDNKPYDYDKNYVKAELNNIEYACFQKQARTKYENVFVIGEGDSKIADIDLYSLFWHDGTVVIEAFAKNIK